jgi:CBS domain-containing protein
MKLKDIMSTPATTIEASAPLYEAARKMRRAAVGVLPVLRDGRLAGIVTDRDLVVRGLSEFPAIRNVSEAMTPDPICLSQDADISHAIDTMMVREVGRVVVIDEFGRAVGVLSASDVAIACQGDHRVGRLATVLGKSHKEASS